MSNRSFRLAKKDKREISDLARDYAARLRNYFVAGIIVTIPLVVTVWVFNKFVLQLDGVLHLVPSNWTIQGWSIGELLRGIPGLGAVTTLFAVVILGFLTTNLVGRRVVRYTEKVIVRVPILSTIYQGVKQLVQALFTEDRSRFSDVVYIEYPRRGIWSIGFLTGETFDGAVDRIGVECLNVFIPTTPNPTSGFYLMIPREQVIHAGLTVEEAFKVIMSAGIVNPDTPDPHATVDGETVDGESVDDE